MTATRVYCDFRIRHPRCVIDCSFPAYQCIVIFHRYMAGPLNVRAATTVWQVPILNEHFALLRFSFVF